MPPLPLLGVRGVLCGLEEGVPSGVEGPVGKLDKTFVVPPLAGAAGVDEAVGLDVCVAVDERIERNPVGLPKSVPVVSADVPAAASLWPTEMELRIEAMGLLLVTRLSDVKEDTSDEARAVSVAGLSGRVIALRVVLERVRGGIRGMIQGEVLCGFLSRNSRLSSEKDGFAEKKKGKGWETARENAAVVDRKKERLGNNDLGGTGSSQRSTGPGPLFQLPVEKTRERGSSKRGKGRKAAKTHPTTMPPLLGFKPKGPEVGIPRVT